jgi:starch-binding outer membrane protein, SusD/RagB family
LHQARFNSRRAYEVVASFTTPATETADHNTQAQLRTIEGYVYVTLSEGWCGNVPFSKLPDTGPIDPNAIEEGVGISTGQMNDTAVTRFDQGLALNPVNRLAAVGKGRALLNLGGAANYAAAEAAVAGVPTTYVFLIEHSVNASTENNPLFSLTNNGRYGVANLEGGETATGTALRADLPTATNNTLPLTAPSAEGLAFRAERDPRIPWEARPGTGVCFTSSVRCWMNINYPNQDADIPLASGVEARLIEAEAALQRGDVATFLARLNTLRAAEPQLTAILYPNRKPGFVSNPLLPVADPADPATSATAQFDARVNLLFHERAFWLFATGHRLGDLRRLARNYGRATSSVFPSGNHFRGSTYGTDVNYPVPFTEQNNKSYDPAACITSTP